MVAVVIQISPSTKLQAGFCISFGIEFDKLQPVGGNVRHERDEMLLGHGMVDRDEMLIFHFFYGYVVFVVCVFCFKGRQGNATATDDCVTHSSYNIATQRTYIKL